MKPVAEPFIENGHYCYAVSEPIKMQVPKLDVDGNPTGETIETDGNLEVIARVPIDEMDALPTDELRAARLMAEASRLMGEELPRHQPKPEVQEPHPAVAGLLAHLPGTDDAIRQRDIDQATKALDDHAAEKAAKLAEEEAAAVEARAAEEATRLAEIEAANQPAVEDARLASVGLASPRNPGRVVGGRQ